MDKITTLGLKNQVSVLGSIPHQQLLNKLSHAKALLLPALNETFGMAYIEALACGCPILYIENTGIDGHLDDVYVGIKIQSQSANTIADGIKKIELNYMDIENQLVIVNDTSYLNKFTATAITKHYLNIIKAVVKC